MSNGDRLYNVVIGPRVSGERWWTVGGPRLGIYIRENYGKMDTIFLTNFGDGGTIGFSNRSKTAAEVRIIYINYCKPGYAFYRIGGKRACNKTTNITCKYAFYINIITCGSAAASYNFIAVAPRVEKQ